MSKMWPRSALEKLWNLDENQDESFKNILDDGDISTYSQVLSIMNTDVGMISVESKNKIELVVHNFPNNSMKV